MRFVAAACALTAAVCLSSCQGKSAGQGKTADKAIPVAVASVTTRTAPLRYYHLRQRRSARHRGVKAQVTGTLMKAYFEKGQYVHQGDKLYEIDPLTFAAAVAQAKAANEQAKAANAQAVAAPGAGRGGDRAGQERPSRTRDKATRD